MLIEWRAKIEFFLCFIGDGSARQTANHIDDIFMAALHVNRENVYVERHESRARATASAAK